MAKEKKVTTVNNASMWIGPFFEEHCKRMHFQWTTMQCSRHDPQQSHGRICCFSTGISLYFALQDVPLHQGNLLPACLYPSLDLFNSWLQAQFLPGHHLQWFQHEIALTFPTNPSWTTLGNKRLGKQVNHVLSLTLPPSFDIVMALPSGTNQYCL